jgi:hypothetical protein
MPALAEQLANIWNNIRQHSSFVPTWVTIPRERTDEADKLGKPFQANEHYFQVRINEMYLTKDREWFSKYDPMVLAVSEFIYDTNMEIVPFIVGPAMLKNKVKKIPTGMVFSDSRIAGLHPYRGGRLCLTVVLCRVQRQNYPQKFLNIVESISSAIDPSHTLTQYAKVANIVLDGVDALLGLGDTVPTIGIRKEIDPDAGDEFEPGYFVLMGLSRSQIRPDELWVRNHQLVYGKSLKEAQPFREGDFLLYSILRTDKRTDENLLPFYPLFKQVKRDAKKTDDANWECTKANMVTLALTMEDSPDLIISHARELSDKYRDEMKYIHDRAIDTSSLSAPSRKRSSQKEMRLQEVSKILDL